MDVGAALLDRSGRYAVLAAQLNQQQHQLLVRATQQIAGGHVQRLRIALQHRFEHTHSRRFGCLNSLHKVENMNYAYAAGNTHPECRLVFRVLRQVALAAAARLRLAQVGGQLMLLMLLRIILICVLCLLCLLCLLCSVVRVRSGQIGGGRVADVRGARGQKVGGGAQRAVRFAELLLLLQQVMLLHHQLARHCGRCGESGLCVEMVSDLLHLCNS